MFAKNWKVFAVLIVLIWSLTTLFQVLPEAKLKELQRLTELSPADLQSDIAGRLEKLPGWDKMNTFQREDALKSLQEEAAATNNMQVLGHYQGYAIVTNLKLGLDLRGGSQLLLQAQPSKLVPEITPEVMRGVETVINNRVNSLGVAETVVQRTGRDRLIVELPGVKDPQEAKDRIGTTALLEFKELVYEPADSNMPKMDALGNFEWKDVGLTGADFKHATAVPLPGGQTWRILFEFKPDGATKFGDLTTRLVNRSIGIFLDGQPTDRGPDGRPLGLNEYRGINVLEPIRGGSGEIKGNFAKEQAIDLALKLNAGSLPTKVVILEERTVGATLGQDSIEKSLIAGVVGIALVMLFMLIIYGVPGMMANVALVLYTLTTLAIFKAVPVTLTLAGIAGFILSIGMAVDANILIFERTKEELKLGKNVYTAIEVGFSRAFTSIFDSNMNSLIACGVLMIFGTSIVKGFAVTLAIGVAVSMFSAITVTRVLLHLVPKSVPLFGATLKKSGSANKSSKDAKVA
ncbi:MAG: protein translocase subunit SecD [Candidatus Obscuribacterales bacterium]|nr:protein translocase subunit SecD [Candidatus Obscuribacterales bacterium]